MTKSKKGRKRQGAKEEEQKNKSENGASGQFIMLSLVMFTFSTEFETTSFDSAVDTRTSSSMSLTSLPMKSVHSPKEATAKKRNE